MLFRSSATAVLVVNSFHHQALKQVAKGLRVVATAPDGIIEAVENEDGAFIIGVQFHPEMMFDKSTFARGIFKKFINICIESKPGEVILKDEIHHREENEEKSIDEKIKEIRKRSPRLMPQKRKRWKKSCARRISRWMIFLPRCRRCASSAPSSRFSA